MRSTSTFTSFSSQLQPQTLLSSSPLSSSILSQLAIQTSISDNLNLLNKETNIFPQRQESRSQSESNSTISGISRQQLLLGLIGLEKEIQRLQEGNLKSSRETTELNLKISSSSSTSSPSCAQQEHIQALNSKNSEKEEKYNKIIKAFEKPKEDGEKQKLNYTGLLEEKSHERRTLQVCVKQQERRELSELNFMNKQQQLECNNKQFQVKTVFNKQDSNKKRKIFRNEPLEQQENIQSFKESSGLKGGERNTFVESINAKKDVNKTSELFTPLKNKNSPHKNVDSSFTTNNVHPFHLNSVVSNLNPNISFNQNPQILNQLSLNTPIFQSNLKQQIAISTPLKNWNSPSNTPQKNNLEISNNSDEEDEDEHRIQQSTMSESKSREFIRIKEVIWWIVESLDKEESQLKKKRLYIQQSEQFADKTEQYVLIFDSLVQKFRLLKKTKEEKTKFVMRKAFRYLFAQLKTHCTSKLNLKEANEICMKHYFSQHVHDSHFVLPFRRNSSIKTMNAAFLKKVFASPTFVSDYRNFLYDNSKKVDQLAYYILPMVEDNKFDKIDSLRRLPWTMHLLNSTFNLANQLLEFEDSLPSNIHHHHPPPPALQQQQSCIPSPVATFDQTLDSQIFSTQSSKQQPLSLKKWQQVSEELCDIVNDTQQIQPDSYSRMRSQSDSLQQFQMPSQQQQNTAEETDFKFSSQELSSYLEQINGALTNFQDSLNGYATWCSYQPLFSSLKRKVIFITPPPLYDIQQAFNKSLSLNFSNER